MSYLDTLDVGQANELKLALRRSGFDNALVKRLCETSVLKDAFDILRGDAHAEPIKRIVDLNAPPVLKEQDKAVVKHLRQGRKPWAKIRLVVMSPRNLQYGPRALGSRSLSRAALKVAFKQLQINRRTMMPWFLQGQRPANICLRDFFLKNQHLVPRAFQYAHEPILFWGTVLQGEHCDYVPGMQMDYGKWVRYDRRVSSLDPDDLDNQYENPCAVFAPAP